MVLVDHADEHLPALCRRGQRHDDHLVMADLSGAEIRLVRDRMAEPDEFVLHPPVPPRQILRRHAEADPVIEPYTIRSTVRPRLLMRPLVGRVGLEPTTGGL